DSDNENANEPVGHQFTGIWKEIELGEEVSCKVYRGKCIYCNKKFRRAKLIKTRAHIVHEFEDYAIPTKTSIEIKSRSTSKKKFKPVKFSEIYQTEVDKALIVLPSREVLAERLLDTQVAQVNIKVEQTIKSTSNLILYIRDEFAHKITNNKVITILKSRGFFDDMQYLTEILAPIKSAILEVEGSQSNLADCYIALLKIGAAINTLPQKEYYKFRNHCI
ncbi:2520_t:CDS:2, partial [Dentiscutata erythropus]